MAPLPGSLQKSQYTKYPSQSLSPALHYLPFASRFPLPHFTLVVLFAFFRLSCFACLLCVSMLDRLFALMASSSIIVNTPDNEGLNFKQRKGENRKDAWYRICNAQNRSTRKQSTPVLLRNFYVGLTISHRQLLDFAAKGNFIEVDPSIAYEIIEGIVGVLPLQKGPPLTQEGTQILEKLCELQKSIEPLKKY